MTHPDFSRRAQLVDAERHRLLERLRLLTKADDVGAALDSLMSQFALLDERCEELRKAFFPEAARLSIGFGEATVWSRTGLPRRVWTAQQSPTPRSVSSTGGRR